MMLRALALAFAALSIATPSHADAELTLTPMPLGPGHCSEIWSVPPHPYSGIYIKLDMSAEGLAKYQAACTASGGEPLATQCPRSHAVLMCPGGGGPDYVGRTILYQGSPDVQALKSACPRYTTGRYMIHALLKPKNGTIWQSCLVH